MTRTNQWVIYLLPVACFVTLFAFFQFSDPIGIGPGGILAVFVLIYLFFLSLLFIGLHFGVGIVGRLLARRKTVEQRTWRLGVRRSYYIASIVAFAPVCLLAIQSIGQLQIRDIGLVTLLCGIGIFYVIKRAET